MSFAAQILQPGGGILLIPFIRTVITCLFLTTITAFIIGVARIHMAILSCLAGGLLLSISFFMSEYDKVLENKNNRAAVAGAGAGAGGATTSTTSSGERAKTD